jgi:hypothetical protein
MGPFARRSRFPKTLRGKTALNICNLLGLKEAQSHRLKYWEIIADNLKKSGWSWAVYRPLIPRGEQSGSLTRIVATESVSSCTRTKNSVKFADKLSV